MGDKRNTIPLQQVNGLLEFGGGSATDPDTGRFYMQHLVLRQGWRRIEIKSGSYLGPAGSGIEAKNQGLQYDAFVTRLKQALVAVNPTLKISYGHRLASMLWWLNGLVLLIVFGGIGVGAIVNSRQPMTTRLLFGGGFTLLGLLGAGFSQAMGTAYWPDTMLLSDNVKGLRDQSQRQKSERAKRRR